MATLVPPLTKGHFRHPTGEWEIYEALHAGTGDDWFLLAEIEQPDEEDVAREMDLLLLHEEHGIILIEVKSYEMEVREGKFFRSWDDGTDFNPLGQLKNQHQAITDQLKRQVRGIYHKIIEVVATHKVIDRVGDLPDGWVDEQLLDANYLSDVPAWLAGICRAGGSRRLGAESLSLVLGRLAPSASFTYSPEGLRMIARANMRTRLEAETSVLRSLDLNRRVLVTGGAGSGKTNLAQTWARRARQRNQSVLFTCYNDPLAEDIRTLLRDNAPGVKVMPFLRYIEERLDRPADQTRNVDMQNYWDTLVEEAVDYPERFSEKFDVIIVDEAQDFEDVWFPMLESLLDDSGARKILMVADPHQNVRGMRVGALPDQPTWALVELTNNYRNAAPIARFMRQRFPGAAGASRNEPFEETIRPVKVPAGSETALLQAVASALTRSVGYEETWVLTTNRDTRELLRTRLGLGSWEQRSELTPCETVRRVKGLEASRVILVAFGKRDREDDDRRQLLYAGVSRAVDSLEILADPPFRKALTPASGQ